MFDIQQETLSLVGRNDDTISISSEIRFCLSSLRQMKYFHFAEGRRSMAQFQPPFNILQLSLRQQLQKPHLYQCIGRFDLIRERKRGLNVNYVFMTFDLHSRRSPPPPKDGCCTGTYPQLRVRSAYGDCTYSYLRNHPIFDAITIIDQGIIYDRQTSRTEVMFSAINWPII